MGYRFRFFHAVLSTAVLSGLLLTSAQAQTYTLTDLGSLGGTQSFATDVNNSG